MVVAGNDENRPTVAAAMIGMTIRERLSLLRLVIGARSIAATPPSAAPTPQFNIATALGEIPRLAAALGFSATALVATPNWVNLYTDHNTMVRTRTIPKMKRRSS